MLDAITLQKMLKVQFVLHLPMQEYVWRMLSNDCQQSTQEMASHSGDGKKGNIKLGLGIFNSSLTIQIPPFSSIILEDVSDGEWLPINAVNSSAHYGDTVWYYTEQSGCTLNCSQYNGYPTTALNLQHIEFRVYNPDSYDSASTALILRGMLIGDITFINILTDAISKGDYNIAAGVDFRAGAFSSDEIMSYA